MSGLIQSVYFDFFTIGALIPAIFMGLLAYFFFAIKNGSRASFHFGVAFFLSIIFFLSYFVSAAVYHPLAAYHRWVTVAIINFQIFHFSFSVFSFPDVKFPLFRKIYTSIVYLIIFIIICIFFYESYHAGKVFLFAGHYWDFDADKYSKLVASSMIVLLVTILIMGIWRTIINRGIERWAVLSMTLVLFTSFMLSGITNILSRDGLFDRGIHQLLLNTAYIIGSFIATIIYLNTTKDRSTFMSKILIVTVTTLLLMVQGFTYFSLQDQEKSFDLLLKSETHLSIKTDTYPADMKYMASYSLKDGIVSMKYTKENTLMSVNLSEIDQEFYNTLIYEKIKRIDKNKFKNDLEILFSDTDKYFAGYKTAILEFADKIDHNEKNPVEKILGYIDSIERPILFTKNKITEIPDKNFADQLKIFLPGARSKIFNSVLLSHVATIGTDKKNLKNEILKYLTPMRKPGSRIYRKDSSDANHFVAIMEADPVKNTVTEAGFPYLNYRIYVHETSKKYIILLLVMFSVIIIGFPFFFWGSLVKPIRNILSGLSEIRQGNLKIQIPIKVEDEFGYMSEQFNKMVRFMEESTATIEAMKSDLQNIIDSIHSVLISVDKYQKITFCNAAAASIINIPADELRMKYVYDLVPYINDYRSFIERTIKENIHLKIEKIHVDINEEDHIFDIKLFPLAKGISNGVVIIIDDISAQVRMEEAVIQSEKMMSLGGLAAGMAHEINNPLSGILMASQNIIRRLSPDMLKNRETSDKLGIDLVTMRKYLEERQIIGMLEDIREMGERASKIVSNMLSFSRKSGSQMLQTDIRKILDNTIELAENDYDLKKKYDFRHIHIVRDFADNISPVECVSIEIQQVILNLLKNAAQALQKNKPFNDDPEIKIRLYNQDKFVIIEIIDNGHGMSDSVCKRIFEPFFTTKEVGMGTGLGLSVSYFIIKNKHNGDMYADSIEGKGTTFTIKLPIFHDYN